MWEKGLAAWEEVVGEDEEEEEAVLGAGES